MLHHQHLPLSATTNTTNDSKYLKAEHMDDKLIMIARILALILLIIFAATTLAFLGMCIIHGIGTWRSARQANVDVEATAIKSRHACNPPPVYEEYQDSPPKYEAQQEPPPAYKEVARIKSIGTLHRDGLEDGGGSVW
ncbi:hypothetical protein Slin15195_G110020 [Septoria linicola]|uniref:Uncharacterized protein n=1 Tax=Septoria linicola TaxID=215465 RepID=A0A9Q9B2E9_9PEZI|nr:hypothetical protein Slin14017_G108370 [Septoria linicola]USW57683.1 hypothetical protein Slin15195_G110020 [Septoria linicola]